MTTAFLAAVGYYAYTAYLAKGVRIFDAHFCAIAERFAPFSLQRGKAGKAKAAPAAPVVQGTTNTVNEEWIDQHNLRYRSPKQTSRK